MTKRANIKRRINNMNQKTALKIISGLLITAGLIFENFTIISIILILACLPIALKTDLTNYKEGKQK